MGQGNLFTTISEARDDFFERLNHKRAIKCPCCDRMAQEYKRRIYGGMARQLIAGYFIQRQRHNTGGWFRYDDIGIGKKGPGAWGWFRYWGLIEKHPNDDDSKSGSGWCRLTQLGKDYVENKVAVPKHVWTYNDKVVRTTHECATIVDALGKHFHYGKLMRGEM